jgi:hypothetical protein
MNFLQICQRARQEASISGTGPSTVVSQTGELGKLIAWVLTAYQDIQDKHTSWNFLRFDFEFPTIATSSTYLPSAVSLAEHARWKDDSLRIYLTSGGVSGQRRLRYRDWDWFRDYRQIGAIQTGQPIEFSIRPDKSLVFWPTPDAIYTVTGEYWMRAQTMSANSDEPLIPAQFHMAMVWKALMYYAADQGAAEVYTSAQTEFTRLMGKLETDQLPRIRLGGALA